MEDANGDLQFQGYGQKSINQFLLDVADLNSGNISMKSLENKRPDILSSLVSTAVVDAVNESVEQNGAWIQVQDIEEIEWN